MRMHCVALLFAILGLVCADKIVFPDSAKKATTASKDDPLASPGKGTPSETETRSFFHPSFGGSPGHHDGLNHHQGDHGVSHPHLGGGDFVGGPHLPGGFVGSGFDVSPHPPHPPHSPNGPHGSHHGVFGSGHSAPGSHHPIGSFGGSHPQHIGPVIPVTDPLSAHLGGNPGRFPVSSGCRFWCRTPKGQVYCCEDANAPQNPVGVKPGVCPAPRPACPPTRSLGPPAPCSNDGSCVGVDKCCYDTCLQEHTCKPPQGFGR